MGHKRLQFALIIGILAAAQVHAQLAQSYGPPGRLIDVGGRKLHLHCSGKGSPTVILVAGGGAYSIDWALVQPNGAAARLDFLSSNTVHITATGSGHEIHLYQPDLVVQALVRAATAVRNRVSLSHH